MYIPRGTATEIESLPRTVASVRMQARRLLNEETKRQQHFHRYSTSQLQGIKCLRFTCARNACGKNAHAFSCVFTSHLRLVCFVFAPRLPCVCSTYVFGNAFAYPRNIRLCVRVQCGQCSMRCGPTSATKVYRLLEDSESRLNQRFAVLLKVCGRQAY